jgi:hypothetical protein
LGIPFRIFQTSLLDFFFIQISMLARPVFAGQKVIGEAIASGLSLDESKMWDPAFKIAAQYVLF